MKLIDRTTAEGVHYVSIVMYAAAFAILFVAFLPRTDPVQALAYANIGVFASMCFFEFVWQICVTLTHGKNYALVHRLVFLSGSMTMLATRSFWNFSPLFLATVAFTALAWTVWIRGGFILPPASFTLNFISKVALTSIFVAALL